uniref:Uncharacterized protein n=1 Tax=Attheya septentrionalis TaxID=420275 RepID=A0A7S2XJ43_9STRA|mmetsp:Transcript_1358/g.2437  ORF Transcript_1358/g.2437 Transcript_1358/m.2437 type:complete len:258 (+) Transcript_1358:131-904(+)
MRTPSSAIVLAMVWLFIMASAMAFAPALTTLGNRHGMVPTTSTRLEAVSPDLADAAMTVAGIFKPLEKEMAQGQFFINLGFSVGGLGIGFIQLPRLYGIIQTIRALASEGPTEGGEKLKLGPIASLIFPAPSEKDVLKVISKIPSSDRVIQLGSSQNFLAAKGYVVSQDFTEVLTKQGCNPLAVFAAFDALSSGKGAAVEPDVFDANVARWKVDGTDAFATDLQKSSLIRMGSYATLLLLLFIVTDLIVETGIAAYA